jgi:hypothetical protein
MNAQVRTDEHATIPQEPLTEAERQAMRAYLQRTEVRLSTLHRIAVAFVSGAGLLILFPIFFSNEFTSLLAIFIRFMTTTLPQSQGGVQIAGIIAGVGLFYAFALSATIPLYALYLLLKDVIHFYFTIYSPGFPGSLFTPSFVLSGVTFSPDESPRAKQEIYKHQYRSSSINFLIPFSAEKRERYFDETIQNTSGEIIPRSRQWEALEKFGGLPDNADRRNVEHFNTAFGLARTLDRDLLDEVATTEASMVRHVLYLRRLVFRYIATLLMFIWTNVIAFIMLPFLQEPTLPTLMIMSLGYGIWSILVLYIMRSPIRWIYRHRKERLNRKHIDRQLTVLEKNVTYYCYAAVFMSGVSLIASLIFYTG